MSAEYKQYFAELQGKLEKIYDVATKARELGLDPYVNPEPVITHDIADRIESLIGPPGIGNRIRELEDMDRQEMAFKVAEEIVYGRFGQQERQKAADQAVRTALALLTEGVTIAPIQGIPEIKIKKNPDQSQYLAVYFAGPIRPAGGTAQALTLVVADFIRRRLGLERYMPSDHAVKRFVEEVRLYERYVRRFQYHVTDEDLIFALRNLPIEATGVGTDRYEVSSFRDIRGIETNRLRGGALIVVVDGIVGRARKLCGICENLNLDGWEWLKKIGENNSNNTESSASFMEEIIVGRPVFSFSSRVGGFRLRYGRARNTGLAAAGIHPAAMVILNKFLTTGVQLRIELPGKSAAVTPVDSIEPPVVKLNDGAVKRVTSEEEAERLLPSVDTILFVGDVLINAGDFIQNNTNLLPSGYDENQWCQDLIRSMNDEEIKDNLGKTKLNLERLNYLQQDSRLTPSPQEALAITELGVPLHPRYTYLWSEISKEALLNLRSNLAKSWPASEPFKIIVEDKDKKTLETLLVPHEVSGDEITFHEEAAILAKCLALDRLYVEVTVETPLDIVNILSGFEVKDKAKVYIGARMGRPEKAKERKLSPYVHGLFPVENAGGAQRDLLKTERGRSVNIEIINRRCSKCGNRSFGAKCPNCKEETIIDYRCPRCGTPQGPGACPACKRETVAYSTEPVDIRSMLDKALSRIEGPLPNRFKGVKRLMNEKRLPEPLEKGILRARYDLSLFKDGTIRFDITDAPLTHFKPSEVGTPIEKLRELGYTHDKDGNQLVYPEQMLELLVQDVVLPTECGKHLVKVSKFLDDLLTQFYGIEPFYGIKTPNHLVGHLILGLAPHTSAAVVGRVIGYTQTRVCYAHPLWHASKRRNCDGDEDAIMLGLDPLINFSKEFLPEQIGGLMDAPLFVIPVINPSEVDKEAHNLDVLTRYPPEFYKLCEAGASPNLYGSVIDTIQSRLGTEAQYQGMSYTEDCSNINFGAHIGAYTSLGTMLEKLESQLNLSEKLKAVDVEEVALRVLTSHFMKDIVGNLRAYTSQRFRCIKCNRRYRRPPLKGVCLRCGGSIMQTVHKGGIEKYLDPAQKLVTRYELGNYYADRLQLVIDEINSIFPEETIEEPETKQIDLTDFLRE